MDISSMTPDSKRLLILIDRFSEPAKTRDESETWIKKTPLLSLINRGVRKGIFKGYDTAPILVDYMGSKRFANISKEGEDEATPQQTAPCESFGSVHEAPPCFSSSHVQATVQDLSQHVACAVGVADAVLSVTCCGVVHIIARCPCKSIHLAGPGAGRIPANACYPRATWD